ncbi:MAG: hypothetical protein K6U14_06755 [Firmicutes bacterium]|nr:hypothetical protein [Alicyclobacillaceae bacterium]MCL6497321.1 hypothetical protein [Bacillota bacterium]
MSRVYDTVSAAVEALVHITESKIEAALGREPERLLALLQEELDHLHTLDQWQEACMTLPPAEKEALRRRVLHWQERVRFLQEVLQQQLGYLDFLRSLFGPALPRGVDLGF